MHDIATKVTSPQLTKSAHQTWVQTEREAHEAWGYLINESPRAAALMHHLVANMDQSAAVVASHGTLSEICGFSVATVKRAISDLVKNQWIQVVQLGGKGAACAYVVNSRVAWAASRDKRHMSAFSARVLSRAAEQDQASIEGPPLRRIPILKRGDLQLPTGAGQTPPSQPAMDGLEPDLPAITELEARGQQRLTL